MITLHFEKIYATKGRWEPCSAALPLAPGLLADAGGVRVLNEAGNPVPTQARATALHPDGSVKWLFVRFMASVPAMRAVDYALDLHEECSAFPPFQADADGADTGALSFSLSRRAGALFERVQALGVSYDSDVLSAPELTDGDGAVYRFEPERWEILERGEVCAAYRCRGWYRADGKSAHRGEVRVACYRGKPQLEIACRLVNTGEAPLTVRRWALAHRRRYLPGMRCATGISNYETRLHTGDGSEALRVEADAKLLLGEANEHNAEVFYGTFFADCTDARGGLCATVYQSQQNFPKALEADADGLRILLVPEGGDGVVFQGGMAREQRVLLDFHAPFEDLAALGDTSTRWQMPNRPRITPEVFAQSGVLEPVFTDRPVVDVEMFLQMRADEHARAYGMLNWGDVPDWGYTQQGRGGGEVVWTNNEYDYPHACALTYMRTGMRRYLDYLLVSARHWMDVDICHHSADPLLLNGQWEHTNGHCKNGRIACSHQWVEGLLDYYHFTGDADALEAAIGIGENDLRQLERPEFARPGDMNARETGWALRAFAALYRETNDARWLAQCGRIVAHFEAWEREYGLFVAPYTDNTRIRVVFMIAVAVVSLMQAYRIDPQESVRGMILRAVDDLIENARLENGLFYYKELPSLKRFGNNPIILHALAIAYELTGDAAYLRAGLPTFRYVCRYKDTLPGGGAKRAIGDAVVTGGPGTKGFAQLMLPVTVYYVACVNAGVELGLTGTQA